jgi:hypothetical protein
MLADIASGNTDTADVFFLIAVIFAVLSAVFYSSRRAEITFWAPVLLALALASSALAWLVL